MGEAAGVGDPCDESPGFVASHAVMKLHLTPPEGGARWVRPHRCSSLAP